ncbi:MAG TPA: diguanylate cyclase [Nitrospiraceae bacterium]|jgi:diguanylate cyclase (GGDEF)-like protein|nr:diguanylate cyclase [Nitrospiraceae bacterium]
MEKDAKETISPGSDKPVPLVQALNKSEEVQTKVEECADELASVNAKMKEGFTAHVPLSEVKQVLSQSEHIESKVEECAEDLHAVNKALGHEIKERTQLERELSDTQAELSDTKIELSVTQVAEEMATHRALHDGVTGLPNRALFDDRLAQALAEATRHAWTLAVMFIDLDQFKSINDSYGHHVGDKVLRMVAKRLEASLRAVDTVSRQGGDEFVCLMQEVKEESNVAKIAEKMISTISATCEIEGVTITVRPSIGIALYPKDGQTPAALLQNADAAMYRAKRNKTGYFFHQLAAQP